MNRTVSAYALALALASIYGTTGMVNAQTSTTPGTPMTTTTKHHQAKTATSSTNAGLSAADRKFINEISQINLLEVKLGEQAQQKAADSTTKSFATKMISDHTNVQEQLKTLATSKGVPMEETLSRANQETVDNLSKQTANTMDRHYLSEMVQGHRKAANLLSTEINRTKDADLKAFAEKTLSGVKQHLKLAQKDLQKISSAHQRQSASQGKPNARVQ